MQIDGLIQALREDLLRVAALGDENTSRAAELLSVAIEASLGRRIQDALAEAALELNEQLDSSHVELRVAGHDLQLVLVREDGTVPEQVDEAFSARITLRLPESLKQRAEPPATREGASVNTWLVQALQSAVEPRRSSSSGSRNRLTGYGRNWKEKGNVPRLLRRPQVPRPAHPPRPAPVPSRQRDPAPRQAADPRVPLRCSSAPSTLRCPSSSRSAYPPATSRSRRPRARNRTSPSTATSASSKRSRSATTATALSSRTAVRGSS